MASWWTRSNLIMHPFRPFLSRTTGNRYLGFPPSFVSASPTNGTIGVSYSYTFTANGSGAITFSVGSGSVPTGLTLSANGLLSGTPTTANTYSYTINATNSFGTTPSALKTVSVSGLPPTFVNQSPPNGSTGNTYTYTFTASGTGSTTFSVASGALPTGLSLSSSGVLNGTPTAAGSFTYTVGANNAFGSATSNQENTTISGSGTAPAFTQAVPPDGTVGTAYSYTFVASGTAPVVFALNTGAFPTGLTMHASTGILSGTPSSAAVYTYTVWANNAFGSVSSATKTTTIASNGTAPVFTQAAPPSGTVGTGYSYSYAASGTTPITFTLGSGTLPSGLSLSTAGVLSGTPSAAGNFTFTITATNSIGSATTSSESVSVATSGGNGGTTPLTISPFPGDIVNNYASGDWDGSSTIRSSYDNMITLGKTTDPQSGVACDIHQIASNYSLNPSYGGARSEVAWDHDPGLVLVPGNEYWMAFGSYIVNSTNVTADSEFIIMQAHTRLYGDTTPDISFSYWPFYGIFTIGTAYSTANPVYSSSFGGYTPSGSNNYVPIYGSDNGSGQTQPIPQYNTWTKFILQKIPGWKSSHNPLMNVWMSKNGAPYVQVANYTGFNTYNITGSGLLDSYARKGIYYFQTSDSSQWPMPSPLLTSYMSPLYFQQGSGLYNNAVAALQPFGIGP